MKSFVESWIKKATFDNHVNQSRKVEKAQLPYYIELGDSNMAAHRRGMSRPMLK